MEMTIVADVAQIIVIDLILSGDNAVVIGMASRRLPEKARRRAIIIGGGGAIGLRMIFTVMAAMLLDVPLLQAFGGLLLLYIAFKLLRPQHDDEHVNEANSLMQAIKTIILADVVMSLDNILAVGGAAEGNLGLLIFGLAFSIPILLLGSELVARMLGRYPILVYLGVIVLVHTSLTMVFHDDRVHERIDVNQIGILLMTTVVTGSMVLFTFIQTRRRLEVALAKALVQAREAVEIPLIETRNERQA